MPTIKDVAREAGVAVGTVSRYLNGNQIKEQNRIRVDQAIEKLGFKPNQIARYLKTNKTNTVGVIIPNLSDIYATTIVKRIEQKLFEFGYHIIVCDSRGDASIESQKAEMLAQRLVDGLIVYPSSETLYHLTPLIQNGIPVVTVDTASDLKCDQVLTDNVNATYHAVEWLINNNHRRIGVITAQDNYFTSRERLKGYMRVHEDYSIPVDDELVKTEGFDVKSGYNSLLSLMNLPSPPSAVVACNYYTTLGVVKAMYHLGIKVPEQLSVIGFDNLGLSGIVQPPLSIIVQPMEEMGAKAAELLLARIKGDYSGFPSTLRLKTELLLRESTSKRYIHHENDLS